MARGVGDGMSSSPINYPHGSHVSPQIVMWTCAGAFTLGGILLLSQLDVISRKILNPKTLWERRRRAQRYRYIKLLQTYNRDIAWPKHLEDRTIILDTSDEYDALLNEVLQPKSKVTLEIVSIAKEIKSMNDLQVDGDFVLILKKITNSRVEGSDGNNNINEEIYIQVPVLEFGLKLAEKIKDTEISTTTFCFVADASGGLALEMMETITNVVQKDDPSRHVESMKQPLWMIAFIWFMDEYNSGSRLSQSKLSELLFGLCRLDAKKFGKQCRTLVVTLPTQSVVAPLLPLLQKAFPSERHVFAYSGAASSVSRAVGIYSDKKSFKNEEQLLPLNQYTCTMLRPSLDRSLLNSPKYKPSLAELPQTYSEALESWISSVDTFFRLKEEEYETNDPDGYLPFTLGLKNLFNTAKTDEKNGSMATKRLALTNLLHYMLGNSAQAKNQANAFDTLLDDCLNALDEQQYEINENNVIPEQRTSIESTAFCHKLILIGDKTLKDTVQPKLKWSLKESKKISGCSCCAPQPGDDDYGDDEYNPIIPSKATIMAKNNGESNNTGDGSMGLFDPNNVTEGLRQRTNASSTSGTTSPTASPKKPAPQFVDGKMGFAFDPTKFK